MTANIGPKSLLGILHKSLRISHNAVQLNMGGNHFRRHFSHSQPLCTTYSSPLPDNYYNEEQKQMQATCAKIVETDINPFVDEWEKNESFPAHKVFKKLGDAGLLGIDKSPDCGGLGLDFKYVASVIEELGTIRCGGVPMAILVQMAMTTQALSRFGRDELKKQFLLPTIAGDFVSCVGVSEPGAGSDVACRKYEGITKQTIHKLGNNCSDNGLIFFEDVRIPAKYIIGDADAGFQYQMLQFQEERMAAALGCLKAIDLVLSETIDYTRQRQAFGKSILENQSIYFRLCELATENECLRALTYQAVDMYVSGQDVTRLASMIKLKAGRLVREVGDKCLQFWGGMGYSREVVVSRFHRDYRLTSIAGGADEIMLEIIAKLLNISPDLKKK